MVSILKDVWDFINAVSAVKSEEVCMKNDNSFMVIFESAADVVVVLQSRELFQRDYLV